MANTLPLAARLGLPVLAKLFTLLYLSSHVTRRARTEKAKEMIVAREEAGKSWYKVDRTDIPVIGDSNRGKVRPLSRLSPVIASLRPTRRVSLYATPERAKKARELIADLTRGTS